MASHTSNTFHDGEIYASMPASTAVYDIEQSPYIPARTPHVDWAWDEPEVHFLCELKDPESPWGLEDEDGAETLQQKLEESWYLDRLATKAQQTSIHHPPSNRNPKTYVVVVAIESLTGPEMDAAGLGLTYQMKSLGMTAPGLVVNIARWNDLLDPRTMVRI